MILKTDDSDSNMCLDVKADVMQRELRCVYLACICRAGRDKLSVTEGETSGLPEQGFSIQQE